MLPSKPLLPLIFFFFFYFRFHLISHASLLHWCHFLSIQTVYMQIIFDLNSHFILHIYLGHIFWHSHHLSIPQNLGVLILLQNQLFRSKHPTIRAHWMIKQGLNGFKVPLHHLVISTNYSHTIISWALKATNTLEFSQVLFLLLFFLQQFSRYTHRLSCLAPQTQQGYFFLVQDDLM